MIKDHRIMVCRNCGHSYADVRLGFKKAKSIYSDEYFFGGKAGYPNYYEENDIHIKLGEYYANILNKYCSPGMLMDVGAASGFIMKGFSNKGWHCEGIEPNSTLQKYGVEEFKFRIINSSLERASIKKRYKVFLLIQVMAHFYDVNWSLKKVFHYLDKDGLVLIETWNKDSILAKITGRYWHEYSPPTTLNYFSKSSLKMIMEKHKFKLLGIGRPPKKINGTHARSLISYKLAEHKSLHWLKGVERIIPANLNIPYPGGDVFWAVFKKTT